MKKLVFINACVRKEDSRTLSIALPIIEKLKQRYNIREIDLSECDILPVTAELFATRGSEGLSAQDMEWGKLVAEADRLVIAAPFWDMSIPSVLKVFIEHISAPDLTFKNNEDGSTRGNCKAKKILYVTTRGMNIKTGESLDCGTPYLKAVGWLWGIPEVITVSAHGMDVSDRITVTERLEAAVKEGLSLCETF